MYIYNIYNLNIDAYQYCKVIYMTIYAYVINII